MKSTLTTTKKTSQKSLEDYEKADRIAFFDLFYSAFQDAVENVGISTDFYYQIAEQNIRLQLAGNALVPYLTCALSHLSIAPTEHVDFTFCLWESQITKRPLPHLLEDFNRHLTHLPWLRTRGIHNEVFSYSDERIQTSLHGEKDILTVADKERKICVYWTQDATMLRYYEIAAPLRMPFQWCFNSAISQMIHSGAVGTEELGGVLLAGKSGSGKSTTALNCLNSDLSYAGDDYVLVNLEPQITAYSVFQTAKVKTYQDLERFQDLKSCVLKTDGKANDEEKPVLFIGDHQPAKIIKQLPLKAVVFPRFVAGADYHLEPISPTSAFKAMITSTINQTPFADKESLQMVFQMMRNLPAYLLIFGENQTELPEIIKQILRQHQ